VNKGGKGRSGTEKGRLLAIPHLYDGRVTPKLYPIMGGLPLSTSE
jgi:hypothetical protein